MATEKPERSSREDSIYGDPALVPLYDVLNRSDHDHEFYRLEIPPDARKLIDLGCGTGRFAIDMAGRGYAVTALDPSPGMIDFARQQNGSDAVDWVVGSAVDIPAGLAADAAVMMGHAFQCLTTDQAIAETNSAIRTALRSGGRFLFESRNPDTAPWHHWNSREEIATDHIGSPVTIEREVIEIVGDLVTFEERFSWSGEMRTSRSTLRFPRKETVVEHLKNAGFTDITVFGFWDRSPFSENSPEMIFCAA